MKKIKSKNGLRFELEDGTRIMLDLKCKHGYRVCPKPNKRNIEIQKLAKGKSLAERKQAFRMRV